VKYLLDTHVVWHHAINSPALSGKASEAIDEAPIEDLVVLDISLYELARHLAVGRIETDSPEHALRQLERAYPILHSDATIAWQSASLDWPKRRGKSQHLDPADRAIVAAALLHDLTLITADKEIHHIAGKLDLKVLW